MGEAVFKKQLWQCMIGQALELKGDIETRRAANTFLSVERPMHSLLPNCAPLNTCVCVWGVPKLPFSVYVRRTTKAK